MLIGLKTHMRDFSWSHCIQVYFPEGEVKGRLKVSPHEACILALDPEKYYP